MNINLNFFFDFRGFESVCVWVSFKRNEYILFFVAKKSDFGTLTFLLKEKYDDTIESDAG